MFPSMDLDTCGFKICDIGMKSDIQSANENKENGGFKVSFVLLIKYIGPWSVNVIK